MDQQTDDAVRHVLVPPNGCVLTLDTETTDLPRKGPLKQMDQARVCQLAMVLADHQGNVLGQFSSLIRSDGAWEVKPGAYNSHGFSTETCDKYGMFLGHALGVYTAWASRADVIVAFNCKFDKQMMEIEEAYMAGKFMPVRGDKWYCAMEESRMICKIPPTSKMKAASMFRYKNPNLEEAYMTLCGKSLGENAHDALYDCAATKEIFFALQRLKHGTPADYRAPIIRPSDDDIPDFASRVAVPGDIIA